MLTISYRKRVRGIIEYAHQLIKTMLYPELDRIHQEAREIRGDRLDAYSDSIDLIFKAMRSSFGLQYSDSEITRMAKEQASKTSDFSRKNMTRILSNAIGIELFFAEPYLKAEMDTFIKSNVDLITTVKENYFSQVKQVVMQGIQTGKRVEDLKDEIEAKFHPAKNHAELIARDQVTKFNSQLNQLRQREIGVSRYKWSTSHDERVRGNPAGLYPNAEYKHYDYELQDNGWGPGIWSWDSPPESGHPGEDYQCRCVAIPVIDVDELIGE